MTRVVKKKLKAIAENTKLVYDAGYGNGKLEGGGDGWYDTFWDAYQVNGTRYHWNEAFANQGWTNEIYEPKYPISKIRYGNSMFARSYIRNTKQPLDFTNVAAQPASVFDACRSLQVIQTLKVNEANTFLNWFRSCEALSYIEFEGTIGNSISFADSPLLQNTCVWIIAEALLPVTDHVPRVLTLHPDVKANLLDAQITYITTQKGWTLA